MDEALRRLFKSCGEDVWIAPGVVIRHPELISLGNHIAIDDFSIITTAAEIGDYVHVASHCSITGGAEAKFIMHDFSGLSAGCRIICASDDYLGSGLTNPLIPSKYRATVKVGQVELKKHTVLGTNCVVLPGITIGEGAAVGACSYVNKDLGEWGIFLGVPARYLKERDRENILNFEAHLRAEAGR